MLLLVLQRAPSCPSAPPLSPRVYRFGGHLGLSPQQFLRALGFPTPPPPASRGTSLGSSCWGRCTPDPSAAGLVTNRAGGLAARLLPGWSVSFCLSWLGLPQPWPVIPQRSSSSQVAVLACTHTLTLKSRRQVSHPALTLLRLTCLLRLAPVPLASETSPEGADGKRVCA